MSRGKMEVASVSLEEIEDVFQDLEFDEEDYVEMRLGFAKYLDNIPTITQSQKHVLVRRLVDEAQFGEIGRELNVSANGALQLFKRGIENVRIYNGKT